MRILILEGHGYPDKGAIAGDICEADLNLEMGALLLANSIDRGLDVSLYRASRYLYKDKQADLRHRIGQINSGKFEVALELHFNSFTNPLANGFETLYYNEASKTLADYIHPEIIKWTGFRDRGIKKRDDIFVLRWAKIPIIIIELGFISNKEDMKIINQKLFDPEMGGWVPIFDGLEKYNTYKESL